MYSTVICHISIHSHTQTYISVLFQILFCYRLLQNTEYSSLCYTVGPWCLSTLNMLVAQSSPTLRDPDCTLPGSSVHRILQSRIVEWLAISYSRGSSWPRDQTQVSCIAGRFFTIWAIREAHFTYNSVYILNQTPKSSFSLSLPFANHKFISYVYGSTCFVNKFIYT